KVVVVRNVTLRQVQQAFRKAPFVSGQAPHQGIRKLLGNSALLECLPYYGNEHFFRLGDRLRVRAGDEAVLTPHASSDASATVCRTCQSLIATLLLLHSCVSRDLVPF